MARNTPAEEAEPQALPQNAPRVHPGKISSHSDIFSLLVRSVTEYAIFVLDPGGHIVTWNIGAQRIKQYEADEIIGKHFSTFYPLSDVKAGKPEDELRVARAEGRVEDEGWRIRKDGTRFWANVVITTLRDQTGEIVGFAKVTRDLTERKKGEEERLRLLTMERSAREQTERTLQQLDAVQSITVAALKHLDLDDMLDDVVGRIADILSADTVAILLLEKGGEGPGESMVTIRASWGLDGTTPGTMRVASDRGFVGRLISAREPIIIEDVKHSAILNCNLGESRIRSVIGVSLVAGEDVIGVLHVGSFGDRRFVKTDAGFLQIVADRVALAIDHARLIHLARSAREEAQIAEATVQARDEFLSVAAHELKTPITSLRIAAQLLLRQQERGDSDLNQLEPSLRAIDQQSAKLARLMTQLLDRVRLQTSQLDLDISRTNLSELVRDAVGRLQMTTERHTLEVSAPENLIVALDAIRFEQVIANLIDNAIKFSPSGGTIRTSLEATDGEWLRLTVTDQGIGIEPERRARLFERFYQAHSDQHRSGMGLGLYISREIVAMHGGTIEAEFPPEGGTRFVVDIPLSGPERQ